MHVMTGCGSHGPVRQAAGPVRCTPEMQISGGAHGWR